MSMLYIRRHVSSWEQWDSPNRFIVSNMRRGRENNRPPAMVEVIIDRLRHLNALELLAVLGAIVAEFQDRMQIPALELLSFMLSAAAFKRDFLHCAQKKRVTNALSKCHLWTMSCWMPLLMPDFDYWPTGAGRLDHQREKAVQQYGADSGEKISCLWCVAACSARQVVSWVIVFMCSIQQHAIYNLRWYLTSVNWTLVHCHGHGNNWTCTMASCGWHVWHIMCCCSVMWVQRWPKHIQIRNLTRRRDFL